MGRVAEEELASAISAGKVERVRHLLVVSKPIARTTETASLLACARVSQDGAGLRATSTCALATNPANRAREKLDVDGAMKRSDARQEVDTDRYAAVASRGSTTTATLLHKTIRLDHARSRSLTHSAETTA